MIQLTLAVLLLAFLDLSFSQQTVVNIPTVGSVQGSVLTSASGRNFNAFRGIPFGLPPVGDLRFKDPVPAKSWEGTVLDATREGPMCIQYNSILKTVRGQEDCLYLNVYTPQLNLTRDPLPVLVWIHGGAWYIGSGNGETDMFGPGYFLNRDIVLVTLNYRLGPLGFLSTEDAEAPGNYGLLDQSLALRWVRNHIRHFGGDPDSVTIFGESAGGGSVELQVLSPYSSGLFHRAIAQSGSSLCAWCVTSNVGKYTQVLAKHVGCPTSPSSELLTCLRTKNPVDLVEIRKHITIETGFGIFPLAFTPRIDKERAIPFLSANPKDLITSKNFNHVPLIAGTVKNEGVLVTAAYYVEGDKSMEELNADPIGTLRYMIDMELHPEGLKYAQKVHDRLLTKDKPYEEQISQLERIPSEYGLFKCIDESIKLFTQYSSQPAYYYYYTHRGQFSFPQMVGVPPEIDLGVCHTDENLLMFTTGWLPLISHPDDIKVSETMIDLWTSFARDGIPKSQHVRDDWLPLTDEKTRYLEINASQPTLIEDDMPFYANLGFWDDVMDLSPKKDEL